MNLHGLLGRAKLSCNLLVEKSRNDASHDLELTRCQSVEFRTGGRSFRLPPEELSRSFKGARNSLEKRFVVDGLCEKVDRARLHCLRAHRYVSMTRDKDDLFFAVCKCLLEFETIKTRQTDIEHKARRQFGGYPLEIVLRRGKRFRGQADGTKKSREAPADGLIIVHDTHKRIRGPICY